MEIVKSIVRTKTEEEWNLDVLKKGMIIYVVNKELTGYQPPDDLAVEAQEKWWDKKGKWIKCEIIDISEEDLCVYYVKKSEKFIDWFYPYHCDYLSLTNETPTDGYY